MLNKNLQQIYFNKFLDSKIFYLYLNKIIYKNANFINKLH